MKIKFARLLLVMAGTLGMASQLLAQPGSFESHRLQALNVSTLGSSVLVRLDMDRPLPGAPSGFIIADPPRVVVDLENVSNDLGRSAQKVGQGALSSINIVQAGRRARLVFNLSTGMNYVTRSDGKALIVTLTPTTSVSAGGSHLSSSSSSLDGHQVKRSIRSVDFQRDKDGNGRVLIGLSDPGISADVKQRGNKLIADFDNAALLESLHKTLDVSSYATPVYKITTVPYGTGTRLTVEPDNGSWEYTAYQADKQYVIEVRRVVADPRRLTLRSKKLGYQGPKVSINFQDGDVRGLLRLMAEELGFNVVISDTVTGNITLVLNDVPADQVLDIIFQQRGLDLRRNGDVVLIAPRQELATNERQLYEEERQREQVEPLHLETFQVNYQKAEEIAAVLTGSGRSGSSYSSSSSATPSSGTQASPGSPSPSFGSGGGRGGGSGASIISSRGSVSSDPHTNLLFVKDTESSLQAVREMLARIDVPPRQVMIEARIVEARDDFAKALGVRMGYFDRAFARTGERVYVGGDLDTITYGTRQQTDHTPTYNEDALSVNLPGNIPSGANLGSIAFSIFNKSLVEFLNLELTALEADGRGKVLSSPRVMTTNQKEAIIEQGVQIPYSTTSTSDGATTTSVTFQNVKLVLKVKPLITPDKKVQLEIEITKDTPGTPTTAGREIDTKHIKTQAMVDNGGTISIGGIYTDNLTNTVNKVPLLGDLPLIGALFRNKQTIHNKNELIVFISPRVLEDFSSLN